MTKKVTGFTLSPTVLIELDKRRGQVSRSAWVEEQLRQILNLPSYRRANTKL